MTMKQKSKTKPLFIIEADYTNHLVVMPMVIVLSEEIIQLGGQVIVPVTQDELDLMADYVNALFKRMEPEEWKQKPLSRLSMTVFSSKT